MAESVKKGRAVHTQPLTAIASTSAVIAEISVKRGLNGIRLAVLGILIGVGLAAGFGVPGPVWIGLAASAASLAVVFSLRWEWSRSHPMTFMHWLTGS